MSALRIAGEFGFRAISKVCEPINAMLGGLEDGAGSVFGDGADVDVAGVSSKHVHAGTGQKERKAYRDAHAAAVAAAEKRAAAAKAAPGARRS